MMIKQWLRSRVAYALVSIIALSASGCGGPEDNVSVHEPASSTADSMDMDRVVFVEARTGAIVAIRVGQTAILER